MDMLCGKRPLYVVVRTQHHQQIVRTGHNGKHASINPFPTNKLIIRSEVILCGTQGVTIQQLSNPVLLIVYHPLHGAFC